LWRSASGQSTRLSLKTPVFSWAVPPVGEMTSFVAFTGDTK
jgi:hypothetical protein